MLRPALVCLAGLATASCSMVENDPHRFEAMAQAVADIPLDGKARPVRTGAGAGLRPALGMTDADASPGALRVEVMDPHDLWDARDTGLRGAVERAAPVMVEAAIPVVADVVAQQVADRMPAPRVAPAAVATSDAPRTTLQLGAFSSPAAARAAWGRITSAGQAVGTLSPTFEAVAVDGRNLTRLKVVAHADAARAVCRAATAVQLGCLRRG